MIYTIAQLRSLARSKDERLEDTVTYPDSWIDDKLEKGFETCEDAKQVFSTSETYDLTTDIANGLTEVEIILQQEPHSIYAIQADTMSFESTIMGNNHIVVKILPTAPNAIDKTVTVKYFFYPTMPISTIEMSPEVYHLFRHSLYVNLYGSLRDKDNEQYHQAQVERFIKEGTFTLPPDFETTSVDNFWRMGWI